MSKYIIKNCPCRMELHEDDCFGHTGYYNCYACTDCVLKQIVEFCKNIKKDHYWGMREIRFSQAILQLLDIQEVE